MPFTLDTHAAVQRFESAGIVREQAEAIVETVRQADSDLATKADLGRAVNRMLIAQLAVAGLLFAAIKLFV